MIEAVSFFLGPVLDEVQVALGDIRVQHSYILVINDLYDVPRAPPLVVGQWPALDSHLQRGRLPGSRSPDAGHCAEPSFWGLAPSRPPFLRPEDAMLI